MTLDIAHWLARWLNRVGGGDSAVASIPSIRYGRYSWLYVTLRIWNIAGLHYHAQFDPSPVVWVDRNAIRYWQPPKSIARALKFYSQLLEDEPDRGLHRFTDHHRYNVLPELLFVDVRPEETQSFERVECRIKADGMFWNGCETLEDFHAQCEYVHPQFEDIERKGYVLITMSSFPNNGHVNVGESRDSST